MADVNWQRLRDLIAQLKAKEQDSQPADSPEQRAAYRVFDFREGWPHGMNDEYGQARIGDEVLGPFEGDVAAQGQIDRYGMGQMEGARLPGGKMGGALLAGPAALAGGAVAGVNELDKALTGGRVAQTLTGKDEFAVDKSTSPASTANVTAFIKGILDGSMQRFGDEGGDDDQPKYPLDSWEGGGYPGGPASDLYGLTDDITKDHVGRPRFVIGEHPFDIELPQPAGEQVPFDQLQLPGEQEQSEPGDPEAGAAAYKAWLLRRMGKQ